MQNLSSLFTFFFGHWPLFHSFSVLVLDGFQKNVVLFVKLLTQEMCFVSKHNTT